METARISSNITTFADVTKSLQEIEKVLNELKASVSTEAEGEVTDAEGKTGDIRITQNKDKSYTFEIRTEEGWKTPVIGDSAIKFKNKPSSDSKEQKKSIDEIEADDTLTSAKVAEKTIYDEKADKFIMPRADYDSGWVTWDFSEYTVGADNPLTLTHDLGVFPSDVKVFFAPGQATNNVTWITPMPSYLDSGWNHGLIYKITTTQILLLNGDVQTLVSSDFASTSTGAVYQDGSVKVLMWK
tara:strand:+ start:5066 stop:5791 length:726 start_codon:yes stop_codon:yes gene_type:complete